jgi:hypothetical protein
MGQQQHLVAPTPYTHMKGLPEQLTDETHNRKLSSTVHTLNVWLDVNPVNIKSNNLRKFITNKNRVQYKSRLPFRNSKYKV